MPHTITSDQLHNQNCYRYLKQLRLSAKLADELPFLLKIMAIQNANTYDENYAYGTLYSQLMNKLDTINLEKLNGSEWDDFFISLFVNDNKNLKNTYRQIQDVIKEKSPTQPLVEHTIVRRIRDSGPSLNYYTPAKSGSITNLFATMIHPCFKPSHVTSLATVRRYRYNKKILCKELHFGTQGQYQFYLSQTNPIFKRFLRAQQHQHQGITHIYFNNLPNEHNTVQYQKYFEVGLSHSLQNLETKHPNVAVITLPADNALLNHHDIKQSDAIFDRNETFDLFFQIAMEEGALSKNIKDFHISPKIRTLIFGTKDNEKQVIRRLLNDSFLAMSLQEKLVLTKLQRQAVWGHFVKFALPDYIISVINPQTFNFACKDGVDRAGSLSAYFNLLRSLDTNKPMNRDEFEEALHAAPAMSRGRGMNHQLKVIWNLVDHYISAHPTLFKVRDKNWLISWRDANCPEESMGNLLERRLSECIQELSTVIKNRTATQALDVLKAIRSCDHTYVKNHALLLDVVISTYAFYQHPEQLTDKNLSRYDNLIQKMRDCDEKPISWMQAFLRFLRALFCLKQPEKTHSENYAYLIDKMSAWSREKMYVDPLIVNEQLQACGQ